MLAQRLEQILTLLHWSAKGLGDIIGVPEKRVRRWLDPADPAEPPEEVTAWLESLARHAEANPPPVLDRARVAAARYRRSLDRRRRSARVEASASAVVRNY